MEDELHVGIPSWANAVAGLTASSFSKRLGYFFVFK
jgi:hypothetical protein